MQDDRKPWWADDPQLTEIVRRSFDEFARELERREPVTAESDPVVMDFLSGASWRELAEARDDLARARIRYDETVLAARTAGFSWGEIARVLGVSKQLLHRRFRTG